MLPAILLAVALPLRAEDCDAICQLLREQQGRPTAPAAALGTPAAVDPCPVPDNAPAGQTKAFSAPAVAIDIDGPLNSDVLTPDIIATILTRSWQDRTNVILSFGSSKKPDFFGTSRPGVAYTKAMMDAGAGPGDAVYACANGNCAWAVLHDRRIQGSAERDAKEIEITPELAKQLGIRLAPAVEKGMSLVPVQRTAITVGILPGSRDPWGRQRAGDSIFVYSAAECADRQIDFLKARFPKGPS